MTWRGDYGRDRAHEVTDTRVTLAIASGEHKGQVLDLRQVTLWVPEIVSPAPDPGFLRPD